METDYRSSSNKEKPSNTEEKVEEREKVQKVVVNEITERKKGLLTQILSSFFEQDIMDIRTSLWRDVLLPNLQDALYNTMQNSIAVIFGRTPANRKGSSGAKINYDYAGQYKYNSSSSQNSRDRYQSTGLSRYDFSVYEFRTYNEADEVLGTMVDYIDRYDAITVSAFLEMIGKDPVHTDTKYGWTSLGASKIKRTRDGYILDLPKVELL